MSETRISSINITYEDIDDRYASSKYSNSDIIDSTPDSNNFNETIDSKLCIQTGKASSHFVSVFDHVLSDELCQLAYDIAIQRSCKPWGVYITTKDVFDDSISIEGIRESDPIKAIALQATRSLLFERAKGILGQDIPTIHGTAVWCLASSSNNSVEYHIDYAELYRYENNIIVPPLYAATCHVSKFDENEDEDMSGGDFYVNTKGLQHYKVFGYKGRLAKSREDIIHDQNKSDWITVKYKYNRGIVFDGDMPHFASVIKYIPPGKKRVILGFNCFTDIVSQCNLRAPEHSDAFNRTIKLYQTMKNLKNSNKNRWKESSASSSSSGSGSGNINNSNKEGKITSQDLLKNPALARLIVLAAKKIKNQSSS